MPSPRERNRNNIRMGVFVSVSLLLALSVVVMLTGAIEKWTSRTVEYTVRFSLRTGVSHLEKGSAVRVGGVKLGEVVKVEPMFEETPFDRIAVTFRVDDRVTLYTDARVYVSAPLIAADAWIDITSVGTEEAGRPALNRLDGAERAGMVPSMLGAENADRFDEILESIRQFSTVFTRVPDDYDAIIGNVRQTTADVQQLASRITHDDWPQWSDNVSHFTRWVAESTDSLNRILDNAYAMIDDGRGFIGDNREALDRFVANLEAASDSIRDLSEWVNEDGRERVVNLLDTGRDALENANAVLARLNREHFDRWATDLGFIMANANHASQQLKLAMTEVRRAPWKALHIPSAQEVEHEHLYEVMRQFALAAGDLNSAAVAAQRILDNHADVLSRDEDALDRIKRNLINQLDKYEDVRKQLMEVLLVK